MREFCMSGSVGAPGEQSPGATRLYRDTEQHPEPEYPAGARRADALEKIAENYLAGPQKALCGGERYLIQVHTTADTLKKDGESAESELERGEISAETSRRLACDASVVQITESKQGETLDVGRKTRTIPPSIRRALKNRDGGCRFPGCCNDRYVDAHHIHHWGDGGETKMSNLVLICRHHHRLVHEGGFGVALDPIGTIQFTDPKGKIIPPAADKNLRGDFRTIIHDHEQAGLEITHKTTVPDWYGEKMDYSAAIESMLYREKRRSALDSETKF